MEKQQNAKLSDTKEGMAQHLFDKVFAIKYVNGV